MDNNIPDSRNNIPSPDKDDMDFEPLPQVRLVNPSAVRLSENGADINREPQSREISRDLLGSRYFVAEARHNRMADLGAPENILEYIASSIPKALTGLRKDLVTAAEDKWLCGLVNNYPLPDELRSKLGTKDSDEGFMHGLIGADDKTLVEFIKVVDLTCTT